MPIYETVLIAARTQQLPLIAFCVALISLLMETPESFGKAVDLRGVSLSSFLASISASTALFAVEVFVFFIIRGRFPEIYGKRNKTGSAIATSNFLHHQWKQGDNMDLYFFQRYLRTLVLLFMVPSIIVAPILAPLNYLQGNETENRVNGLDTLSWSNIGPNHTDCYWAHFLLSICLGTYTCWIVWWELCTYIQIRQASRNCALRTVLIDGIPPLWTSEKKLSEVLECFGRTTQISFNQDTRLIHQRLQERQTIALLLEKAETELIRKRITDVSRRSNHKLWTRGFSSNRIGLHREHLRALNLEISHLASEVPALPSAFVTFETPIAASIACQSVIHHQAAYMTPRAMPISPSDVIWENISLPWWSRTIRSVVCNIAILATSVVCAAPISLSSLLSQALYLSRFAYLKWLQKLPNWVLGIIQGLLPPVCLNILLRIFSKALGFLVRKQGIPLRSLSSLKFQDYYFSFLLVQLTISVTLSAGLTVFMSTISSGGEIATTLAQNLPKASNYFISYVVLQALSISAKSLLRVDSLVQKMVLSPLMDRTVSQLLERNKDSEIEWGTFIPVYTNLACIGLIYAIISPIILPFQLLVFILSWSIHINTVPHNNAQDYGGIFYPKAIKHLLVGIYTMQISLLSLFLLVRNSQGQAACIGQVVLCTMAVALTALYHLFLRTLYDPLLQHSPASIRVASSNDDAIFHNPETIIKAAKMRLPKDDYGLSDLEVKACQELYPGVDISTDDARIHQDGTIKLIRQI